MRIVDVQILHIIEEISEIIKEYLTGEFGKMFVETIDVYGLYMLILSNKYSQIGKIKPIMCTEIQFLKTSMQLIHYLTSYIRKRQRYGITLNDVITHLRNFLGSTIFVISTSLALDFYRIQALIKNGALLQFVARPMNKVPHDTDFNMTDYQSVRIKVDNALKLFNKKWQATFIQIFNDEKFKLNAGEKNVD